MSHSISPLHPTRFSVCFSVCFFVRWIILLLVATIAIDASAQSQRRKKKRSWKEKVEYADSIRLEIRRASDEGRLLQWGDSILRARRDSGSMDEKKYNALRKRLVKYDQLLHAGNAILAERYQRINYDTAYIMRPPGRWTIKLRGNLSGAWIRTTGRNGEDQYHTEVESDFRGTLSMAVAYRGLGAAVALNPMKLAGKSQDYELNVNSYSNRFGFDIVFLSSKTYHGKASMNDRSRRSRKGPSGSRPSTSTSTMRSTASASPFRRPSARATSSAGVRAASWWAPVSTDRSRTSTPTRPPTSSPSTSN